MRDELGAVGPGERSVSTRTERQWVGTRALRRRDQEGLQFRGPQRGEERGLCPCQAASHTSECVSASLTRMRGDVGSKGPGGHVRGGI